MLLLKARKRYSVEIFNLVIKERRGGFLFAIIVIMVFFRYIAGEQFLHIETKLMNTINIII